jgi:hypothetical protein
VATFQPDRLLYECIAIRLPVAPAKDSRQA